MRKFGLVFVVVLAACGSKQKVETSEQSALEPNEGLGPQIAVAESGEVSDSFEICDGTARIGQTSELHGISCDEVCSEFGFQSCVEPRKQDGGACGEQGDVAGACDARNYTGMMECVCGTGE